MENFINTLSKVISGDEEATQELGLQQEQIEHTAMPSLSWMNIQLEHARCCEIVAAARHLGLATLEATAMVTLNYLVVIAKSKFNQNLAPFRLDPSDYAQTMQAVAQEIQQHVVPLANSCSVDPSAPSQLRQPGASGISSEDHIDDPTDHMELSEDEDPEIVLQQQKSNPSPKAPIQPTLNPGKGKRVHYKKVECPLCKKTVVHLFRHLHALHVKKNERIPVVRVPALMEMARHGDTIKAGEVKQQTKKGRKVYSRKKEICPLCEKVTIYLTTHLQRVHKLEKNSATYQHALLLSRSYRGKSAELMWDESLIRKSAAIRKKPATPPVKHRGVTLVYSSSSDEEQPSTSAGKKSKQPANSSGLQLLLEEEMLSDSSGSPYQEEVSGEEDDIIPASPTATRSLLSKPQTEETPPCTDNAEVDGVQGQEDSCSETEEEEESQWESEESEREMEDFANLQTYYSSAKGRNVREQLLIRFYEHLRNILGGCKEEEQAVLHAQQVRRVLQQLDPKGTDAGALLKNAGIDVWKYWAKPLLDGKKSRPGTIKSYLGSLANFCSFVFDQMKTKVSGFPDLPEEQALALQSVSQRFRAMASSITKIYRHERWEKQLEDEDAAVDPVVAQEIMDTKVAREAIMFLQLSFSVAEPSEAMFLSVRDFLIARMALENCQRPGPLENATLSDLKRAKKVEETYVMRVARHKTSKSGPAPITISDNLMTNLRAFVENIRPAFANEGVERIFTTRDGASFTAGTIGKRISSWWQKAVGRKISATQVRKMGSTETMDLPVDEQACVQTVMTHRRTTAEAYYQINKKTIQAVRGAEALRKKLNTGASIPTLPPEGTLTPSRQPQETSSQPCPSPATSVTSLTSDQVTDIDLLFADIVESNAALTHTTVRNRMSESIHLMEQVHDMRMVRKVYRRVRYLQSKSSATTLSAAVASGDLEEEAIDVSSWAGTSTSQLSSSSSRRQTWSAQDSLVLQKAFAPYDRCPTKEEIANVLAGNDVLEEIRNRNTFGRTYEKVKSLFKKRAKR